MFDIRQANYKSAHLLHKMTRGYIFIASSVPNTHFKRILGFLKLSYGQSWILVALFFAVFSFPQTTTKI